jgi:hypothetical protein
MWNGYSFILDLSMDCSRVFAQHDVRVTPRNRIDGSQSSGENRYDAGVKLARQPHMQIALDIFGG